MTSLTDSHTAARSHPDGSIAALLRTAAAGLSASSGSARLDAEVLLAFALDRARSHLHAWPERMPTPTQAERFRALVARRCAGAPVAYLTGRCEFFSLPLAVDDTVLIPRPETELIVELALARIPAGAGWRVLDAGTGSGAIGIAIALARARCRVVASDVSTVALAVAQRNAEALGCSRLQTVAGDWLTPFAARSFDLIAANPPYVRDGDPHLAQGDVRAEPRSALAGGPDGLDAIRRVIAAAPAALRPRGWLILEHGQDQRAAVVRLAKRCGFARVDAVRDLAGRDRALCARAA